MNTRIIEATNQLNWGKFLVGVWDKKELRHRSEMFRGKKQMTDKRPMLVQIGWDPSSTVFVQDLQTGEGALFRLGGVAKADLDKHQIWVCPLFESFLEWLYTQPQEDVVALNLPRLVELPNAPFSMQGYRRTGAPPAES